MTTFTTGPHGITGHIDRNERQLLQQLFASVVELLEPEDSASEDPLAAAIGWDDTAEVPSDPAVLRLLPQASQDDDEALELRRLTERSLRQSKVGALKAAAMYLDSNEQRLDNQQAQLLLRAFNDVRLVLAERLEIAEAQDAESLTDSFSQVINGELSDAEFAARGWDFELAQLYFFISSLQQELVIAMRLQLSEEQ